MSNFTQTLYAIPSVIDWWITKHTCKHRHLYFDGGVLVCDKCYTEFPVSDCLTQPSGVFLRIEKRIEQEQEYDHLVKLAEEYQKDSEF